ncbi:MAG TPA: YceI family protein [Bacteroidales bacterium]|nr:YceI family protein [Bacteroidales bacterium]
MKHLFILIVAAQLVTVAAAQTKNANTEKTAIVWFAEKVTGDHKGTVNLKSGWIDFTDNRIKGGEFVVDMSTIKDADNNQKLESHLKSEDFFGVEKYPTAKLVLKESTPFEKGTATVKGELTIKDKTEPVEFKAALQNKDDGLWFFTNLTVDRTKYNVRYGSGTFFDNLGDRTIYDEFKLRVSVLVN